MWLSGKHFGVVKWKRVSGGIAVVTNTGRYGQVGVFQRRQQFQKTIQSESKFIHFNTNIWSNNAFSNL